MSDTVAGSLTYKFKADLSELRAGMAQIQQQLSGLGSQAQSASRDMARGMENATRATKGLSSQMSLTMAALKGGIAGFARGISQDLIATVKQALDEMQRLQDAGKQLGSSTSALRNFSKAAGVFGIDPGKAVQELQQLASKLREAQVVGGDLADRLAKIGVNIKNFDLSKPGEFARLFEQIAEKVRTGSSELDKLNAVKFLGLSEEFTRVFDDGIEDVRKFAREAKSESKGSSEAMIAEYREFQKLMSEIWKAISDNVVHYVLQIKNVALEVADAIASAYRELLDLIARVTGASVMPSVTNARKSLNDQLKEAEKSGQMPDGVSDTFNHRDPFRQRAVNISRGGGTDLSDLYKPRGGGGGGKGAHHAAKEATDAVETYIKSIEKARVAAEAEAKVWGLGNVAREKAVALAKAEEIASENGKKLTDDQRARIMRYAEALGSAKEKMKELHEAQQRLNETMREFGDMATKSFDDLISKSAKLKDVLAELARSIASMALKKGMNGFLDGIMEKGGGGGGGGGLFAGLFSMFSKGLFSGPFGLPAFANGGTLPTGQWGIVGEAGPELIKGPASITPMDRMGGGGPRITINNNAGVQVTTQQMSPEEIIFAIDHRISQNNRQLPAIMKDRQRRSN